MLTRKGNLFHRMPGPNLVTFLQSILSVFCDLLDALVCHILWLIMCTDTEQVIHHRGTRFCTHRNSGVLKSNTISITSMIELTLLTIFTWDWFHIYKINRRTLTFFLLWFIWKFNLSRFWGNPGKNFNISLFVDPIKNPAQPRNAGNY